MELSLEIPNGESDTQTINGIQVTKVSGVLQSIVIAQPVNGLTLHIRSLHIRAALYGVPVARVLVANGAAKNVLLITTMKRSGS